MTSRTHLEGRAPIAIVVYGATGLVGRSACAALAAAGATFAVAGRDRRRLADLPYADRRVAHVDDPETLAAAFAGARVVLSCVPAAIAEPVLAASLAAGAHYIDASADQAAMHALYERHESTARKAGKIALLGAGVGCALGDLAAGWAAAHIAGHGENTGAADDVVRAAPIDRLADDRPLDEIAVSYVFDDLVLSPAGQRAVFAGMRAHHLAWRRDRWERCAPAAETRRINAGLAMGGERDVASFPGGEVISVPRHIASRSVQTFASTARGKVAQTALRLAARALPLVPRAAELLAAYEPGAAEYARTRFAIIAQARRGFDAAQVIVRGADLYATSARLAAWCARSLATRAAGPVGMRAATELFRPRPALAALAEIAGLAVEPSFGST